MFLLHLVLRTNEVNLIILGVKSHFKVLFLFSQALLSWSFLLHNGVSESVVPGHGGSSVAWEVVFMQNSVLLPDLLNWDLHFEQDPWVI